MVQAAWLVVIGDGDPSDRKLRRRWYEGQMFRATGQRSSTACSPISDFVKAMAHFEGIADPQGPDGRVWRDKLGQQEGNKDL